MKRFACLFLLLSFTTSLLAGIDEDLAELFEGDDSPGLFYQKTAREVLGKVTDEPLRKLAIKTSKLAFPEINSSRVDTLYYLFASPSIRSASELQHVFSLFEQKKESYCNLPYGPRLEKLKTLVHEDRFSLRQQRETVPAVKSIFYPPLENRDAQEHFIPEIKSRIQKKNTTYDWFTLFTDRLSILMTHPTERTIVPGVNTRFDAYKVALTPIRP